MISPQKMSGAPFSNPGPPGDAMPALPNNGSNGSVNSDSVNLKFEGSRSSPQSSKHKGSPGNSPDHVKRPRLETHSTSHSLSEAAAGAPAEPKSDKSVPARMLIHADQAAIVVGSNGSVINQIRNQARCNISIVDKDIPLEMNPDLRILRLAGENLKDQAEALRLLLQKTPDMGSCGEKPLRILLPNTAAGAIIGPKGATISEMGAATNCKIELDKQMVPGLSDRCCRIWGGDLCGAVNRIHEILLHLRLENRLADSDFELPIRCKISDCALDFVHKSPIPPHFTSGRTYDLLVTKEEASFIVGKQGVRIRAIRDSTRASVEIRDGPASLRIVEIGGDFISKQKAVLMVLDDSFKRAEPLTSVQFMFDYSFWAYVDRQLPRLVDRTGVKVWWEDSECGKCLSIAGPPEMRTLAAQILAEIIESERFEPGKGTPQNRSPMQHGDRTPQLSGREFNNMSQLANPAVSPGPGGAPGSPGPPGFNMTPGNSPPHGAIHGGALGSPHPLGAHEPRETNLSFGAGVSPGRSPGPPGLGGPVGFPGRSPGPPVRDFTRGNSGISHASRGPLELSPAEQGLKDIAKRASLNFPEAIRMEMNIDVGGANILAVHIEAMSIRSGSELRIITTPTGPAVVMTGQTVANAYAMLLIQERLLRGSTPSLASDH